MHSLSKKMITEAEIPSEFTQVKSVLSQQEKANVVEIIGMTKGASGSELKKIQTVVVLGHKSSGITSGGQEYSPVNPSVQEYSPVNPSVQEYSPVKPSVQEYSPVNPSVTSGGQ